MTARSRSLVILGATGDLTSRLLLPGLAGLVASDRELTIELIGSGTDRMSDEEWRARVSTAVGEAALDPSVARLIAASRYQQADATVGADLAALFAACSHPPALYFALPPAVTILSCAALETVEIPADTVLALEKPFGTDRASAEALNRQLEKLVPERQIQRVDHFLGKSTVLNLLGLRFANRLFASVWNADDIESVTVFYDESLALEERAGYYDKAGALVDMIQSHLLLVLALFAMEPPSTLDADDLRGGMAQLLRATRVVGDDPVASSRRARYGAGSIAGRAIPAYLDEPGVDAANHTETLAEITLEIANWRWAGVPFVLRSGKALDVAARKEIIVRFKPVPHLPGGFSGAEEGPSMRIGLGPETVTVELDINGEGDPFELDRIALSADFAKGELAAYGEVLAGILDGDPTLSVRADVAEQCWRIVEPVIEAWRADLVPMAEYPAGSAGPEGWTA